MKKALAVVILIIAIIGLWWYASHRNSATVVNLHPVTTSHPDPSNATFSIDDQTARLENGKGTMSVGLSGLEEEVDLTDTVGYGDLNGDRSEDAVFFLVVSNPVSGTLNSYLAAYVSGPVGYKTIAAVPVGTQITPKSVSVKGHAITVTYLDRRPEEPLADEPTVLTTQTFTYDPVAQDIE